MTAWEQQLPALEQRIGYTFKDRSLLFTALTHSSFVKGDLMQSDYNERLEFLGDAVLELCVSERLFAAVPAMKEGQMTRRRARLVCEEALFIAAKAIALQDHLRLGRGEENSGGRRKPSVVSDALEALIGAIYLDGGWDCAKAFILAHVADVLEVTADAADDKDYKTRLQETVQARHLGKLRYEEAGESGPEHDKVFYVTLYLEDRVIGKGEGRTKQSAGQMAAEAALSLPEFNS